MKRFRDTVAQGELYIVRVAELPENIPALDPVDGKVIVGHSETGHHHVMDAEKTTMYRLPEEIYEWFLVVDKPDVLEHLRPYDTHEPIAFRPGVYRVRAGREYRDERVVRSDD